MKIFTVLAAVCALIGSARPAFASPGIRDPAELATYIDGVMSSAMKDKHVAGGSVGIQRALGLAGPSATFTADASGRLTMTWGLRELKLVPAGPLEYRDEHGSELVLFREDASGHVTRAFVGSAPMLAFEPILVPIAPPALGDSGRLDSVVRRYDRGHCGAVAQTHRAANAAAGW